MPDLSSLKTTNRLLFSVPLRPVQGDRFQPTGFPALGAATYQTKEGQKLFRYMRPILTGEMFSEIAVQSLIAMGARACLFKPFAPVDLDQIIKCVEDVPVQPRPLPSNGAILNRL